MKDPYIIRAHHGMCVAFFQGKGYSSEFTYHMSKIIEQLEKKSNNPHFHADGYDLPQMS